MTLDKSPWMRRLLLMTIVAPFVLLWGEVFTRALLPQNVDPKMDIYKSDRDVGFTYMPNARTYEKGKEYNALYQINTLGLRDREYGPKTEGVFRVLLLGDSFCVSHGQPIEDSLSRQMEKALQKIADSDGNPVRVEVINGAVAGYSPYNYWKAYRRWAPVFKPDAVLVGLSPDDYDCSNESAAAAPQPTHRGELSIRMLRKWLSWNSELYILMRNFFYYNDLAGRTTLRKSAGGVENEGQLELYMASHREDVAKAWAKAFFYLHKLRIETAADGVTLILTKMPLKMEIDSEQYRQMLASKGLKDEQIDLDQQWREISAFCKKEHVPVLDARAALRKRNSEERCYFVLDGHWTAEGIRTTAASLAGEWSDLGLPPFRASKGQIRSSVTPRS